MRRFPDIKIEVQDMIIADGRVVVLERLSGTQQEQQRNLAPIGKPAVWNAVIMYGVYNGKIQNAQYYT